MPRKPTWICIGAQKAATTWLANVLAEHHLIWVPRGAEMGFFDREILKRPSSWYEDLFDDPSGQTTISGEKTPTYSCLKPQSIAYIKRYLSDVKLILVLRRPDERAWSQARMETSKGSHHFSERRLTPNDHTCSVFNLGTSRNTRLTRYDRILANWRRHFPAEQMLVLFHEDVEEQPRAVLRRVCAFLDIPESPAWTDELVQARVFVTPPLDMPPAARWYLQRRYRSMVETLSREFPASRKWLDPTRASLRVSFWQKVKVRLIADVATIPFNVAYRCYDAVRDLRMLFRLRELDRAAAASAGPDQPTVGEPLAALHQGPHSR
ncbi:MAG TPA: sulfotransferase [Pirellulales bacterium]|nr:sulfotransferase [Pirellulales bacterium]